MILLVLIFLMHNYGYSFRNFKAIHLLIMILCISVLLTGFITENEELNGQLTFFQNFEQLQFG